MEIVDSGNFSVFNNPGINFKSYSYLQNNNPPKDSQNQLQKLPQLSMGTMWNDERQKGAECSRATLHSRGRGVKYRKCQ